MFQKAKIIVIVAALLSVQPVLANNERDNVNFRRHIMQHGFNPQDYDISNMTAMEHAAHLSQRQQPRQQQRQRKAGELASATRVAADTYGPFIFAKESD